MEVSCRDQDRESCDALDDDLIALRHRVTQSNFSGYDRL